MTRDEQEKFEKLSRDLEEIMPTLKEMTEAWKSASWFARAVKWTGGIAAAVIAIGALIKLGITKN